MRSTKAFCRLLCLPISLAMALLLAGCSITPPVPSKSIYTNLPTQSAMHTFDLPAQQQLRDITGALSVQQRGADTGILLVPGERVEIFATGTVTITANSHPSGPDGDTTCRASDAPIHNLPCGSIIYSIGSTGIANEAGTHQSFIATSIGNLFLGVNARHVKSNAGSFHIKLLTLPNDTVEGLWSRPNDGFMGKGPDLK